MRILTSTVILGLPLMALGQTEPQQTQEQTKETQATAPAKAKKMRPAQEQSNPQAKPETGTNVRGQTDVKGRAPDVNRNEPGARSSTNAFQKYRFDEGATRQIQSRIFLRNDDARLGGYTS